MKARLLVSLCAIGAAIAVASCSKGLGNNPENPPGDTSPVSTNRPVGLDIGLQPTDPISGPCATGVVVPAIGGFPERDIVLLAFTTASDAANGDGNGTALSRDAVTDGNTSSDVFLAAICSQDVETRAFSQSLAGKLRHPRCATCHSMQSPTSTAFVSSAVSVQAGGSQPHLGPLPGSTFPNNDPETCKECHNNPEFTTFPVKDWQAPAVSFDLRSKTVLELAEAAGNVPADEPRHFITDPRVLWALDTGITPTRGDRNGAADDDHDGIDEPSDRDGVIRTVPGGSAVFLQQIEEWTQSGYVTTAAGAVSDITLVSRAANVAAAGDGASTRPHVTWARNIAFAAPGRVGTIYIVYQSDATNLVDNDINGATDIFRTAINLMSDASGNLDLVVSSNATLVSAANGAGTIGNGASTMASVGGPDGRFVAFQSLATNLVAGFGDINGPTAGDIFLRDITTNSTELVSHETGNLANGGNGESTKPAIDLRGRAIAFESDATDLIATDGNLVRDVFYTNITGGTGPFAKMRASVTSTGTQGTGGASSNASIYVGTGGRTLVAFESSKTDLAPSLTAPSNVYAFDSASGNTTLLNQVLSTRVSAIGDGSARNAVIAADGQNVAFESDASNIDILRTDSNSSTDVFLVSLVEAFAGAVLPHRFSVTTIESVDGDGASTEPCFGSFASGSSTFRVGFATYTTAATNLGTPDSTNLMVAFLDETYGVLADFTVTPTSGAAPLTVQFTDISIGSPTTWAWDFDNDGTVDSTEQSPMFTYTTAGTYTVKLTASNADATNEVTKTDVLRAIGPPVTDFTATPTSGTAALAVQFTDTSTEQPTSWLWDFGDGNSSTLQNPMNTYTASGIYTVALTATNVAGAITATKTNFVEVFAPVVAMFTTNPSPATGPSPLAVAFDASATTGATSYAWDFGDGSSGTGVTVNHTYSASGSFIATLTATGPGGTNPATAMVSSTGSVTPSFTLNPSGASTTSGYPTDTLSLDASASVGTPPLTYDWDLDDDGMFDDATGVTVTGLNIGTQFPLPNSTTEYQAFDINLRVTEANGGQGIVTLTFTSVAASIEEPAINASKDTTIYSDPSLSGKCSPANDKILVGRSYNGTMSLSYGSARALLKFDIENNITPGSTILSAEVRLVCNVYPLMGTPPDTNVSLFEPSAEWDATGVMTGAIGMGQPGAGGVVASVGDATWLKPMFGSAPSWTGGSPVGAAKRTVLVDGLGPHTWLSNAALVADVQSWVTTINPTVVQTNLGWLLIGGEAVITEPQVRGFASSEEPNPADRPKLMITYRPPLLVP